MTYGSSTKWLRLEGFVIMALSVYFYFQTGLGWWLFALLLFSFDVGMLGYLQGPKFGALVYNLFHSYISPVLLLAIALLVASPFMTGIALIWFAHIGLDRMLGYGLKSPEGFAYTHLGKLGKHA